MNGPGLSSVRIGAAAEQEARKLAGLEGRREDELAGVKLRQATIIAYDSGTGLATITLGGDTTSIVGVRSLSSYRPTVGDTGVWVIMVGTAPLLIGAVGGGGGMPTGGISAFGGSTAPSGWLLCDGAARSRTTYAALFAAIGTGYGVGDGSTTFNVPNLQDRFPLGLSGSSDPGDTGGSTNHDHPLSASGQAQIYNAAGSPHFRMRRVAASSWTTTVTSAPTNGAAGAESLGGQVLGAALAGDTDAASAGNPPYQVVAYIIKT